MQDNHLLIYFNNGMVGLLVEPENEKMEESLMWRYNITPPHGLFQIGNLLVRREEVKCIVDPDPKILDRMLREEGLNWK